DRSLCVRLGPRLVSARTVKPGAVIVAAGAGAIAGDGAVEVGERTVEVALLLIGQPAIEVGQRQAGLGGESSPERPDRGIEVALPGKREPFAQSRGAPARGGVAARVVERAGVPLAIERGGIDDGGDRRACFIIAALAARAGARDLPALTGVPRPL